MGVTRERPSERWTSISHKRGKTEASQRLLESINKVALISHATRIKGQKCTMSQTFSVNRHWLSLELVAEDDSLVVARILMPSAVGGAQDSEYVMRCEAATVSFVRARLPAVPVPEILACEGRGSRLATKVGAPYMLVEGFHGTCLGDKVAHVDNLTPHRRDYILTQWAKIIVELASLSYPKIGCISSVTQSGEPNIDKLAEVASFNCEVAGPFSATEDYVQAIARHALDESPRPVQDERSHLFKLATYILLDIVERTDHFSDPEGNKSFGLFHKSLQIDDMIVDAEYNIVAVTDWPWVQTMPAQLSHLPRCLEFEGDRQQIPLILGDETHPQHGILSQQQDVERCFTEGLWAAREELAAQGRNAYPQDCDTLYQASKGYRISLYWSMMGWQVEPDMELIHEMLFEAYGWDANQTAERERYLRKMERRLGGETR